MDANDGRQSEVILWHRIESGHSSRRPLSDNAGYFSKKYGSSSTCRLRRHRFFMKIGKLNDCLLIPLWPAKAHIYNTAVVTIDVMDWLVARLSSPECEA